MCQNFQERHHKSCISYPKKLLVFPFWEIPIKFTTRVYFISHAFHALLKGWFQGPPLQLHGWGKLMSTKFSKWAQLCLGKRKKLEDHAGTVAFVSARNCQMLGALWRGLLSRWSRHEVYCHNSRNRQSEARRGFRVGLKQKSASQVWSPLQFWQF